MADTIHVAGATSKIVTVEAIVISTGLPYTAGAFNTATISATYTRDGATPTAMTLVTATAGTYTTSGFVHRGKGVYEIGAPTAALASGATGVEFAVDGIADVLFRGCRIELASGDPRAATVDANVTTVAANALTASALATDAVTEIANAVVEAEIDALETYNRTTNTAATITGPTNGATTLTITTNAAFEPIASIS